MKISCIVAMNHQRVIGAGNQIPWYLPADLKYFKKTTVGHAVIMGRNCFESIGRPLPNRTNIVISRDAFFIASSCLVVRSIEEALEAAHNMGESEVFVIGGGQIYDQTQDLWDKLYLTQVDCNCEGDVFFPDLDLTKWKLDEEIKGQKDDKNVYDHSFLTYHR
ncbi:MAG: dihydrofolate reductase [Saprospiraceae bacterium]|nr:dihydrofolate reductase [Saprospiraceae bacterium]